MNLRKESNSTVSVRSFFSKFILAALVCGLFTLATTSTASAADYSKVVTAGISVAHDNDISAAAKVYDHRDDTFITTNFTYGKRAQLTMSDRITYSLDGQYETYQEFTGFNNLSLGLSATWNKKLGIGREAPQMFLRLSAAKLDFSDPDRDGAKYEGTLGFSWALRNVARIDTTFTLDSRSAPISVFRENHYTSGITATFDLPRSFQFSAGYGQMRGDIPWHCTGNFFPPAPSAYENTFDMIAYRRVSRTRMQAYALSYPLSNNKTAFVKVERNDTNWSFKNYPNNIYTAGFLWRIH